MKFRYLLTLTLSSFLLASCVDNNYDLGNVNTDDVTIGQSWVAPLGTGYISLEDVIDTEKSPSVKIEDDGSYIASFTGSLKESKSILLSNKGLITVASADVETNDLSNIFEGEFVLSLTNPHIKIVTENAPIENINCRLNMTSYGRGNTISTFSVFPLSQSTPKNWIGPISPTDNYDFNFVENKEIPELIKIIPEHLSIELQIEEEDISQITQGTFSNIQYDIEIPFVPAKDFYAVHTERIDNAFDEDFIDYIFNEGSTTIYGEVINEMPFDLGMEMIIIDSENNPLDINLDKQSINGDNGVVSFVISEEDMPKMKNARHIDIKIYMNGRENSYSLKKDQSVTFNLKLKKEGGISI